MPAYVIDKKNDFNYFPLYWAAQSVRYGYFYI